MRRQGVDTDEDGVLVQGEEVVLSKTREIVRSGSSTTNSHAMSKVNVIPCQGTNTQVVKGITVFCLMSTLNKRVVRLKATGSAHQALVCQ